MHDQSLAYDGGMDNFWLAAAWSLLPTVGVSIVFFVVLRGILRFDRTERKVHAQIEAEERAARGLPPRPERAGSGAPRGDDPRSG